LDLHLEVFVPKKKKEIAIATVRGWGVLGLTTNAMKIHNNYTPSFEASCKFCQTMPENCLGLNPLP
jgi:hypothetical protein